MDIKVNVDTTIVFDLDDTLYKEIDFLKSAYREIARSLVKENWQQLYGYMFALYRERENVFTIISKKYGVATQKLIDQYRSHKPFLSLTEGASGLIEAIKEKGGKLAVLTDGRSVTQINKVRALGIYDIIDKLFISEELGSEKPSENNFMAVEDHFPSKHYFYIADNLKKDFVTANIRGWHTIGLIDNGLNIHFSSQYYLKKDHLPQHSIISLQELKVD